MSQSINFFVAYTAQELRAGVAVSSLVLDRITTLTGETIETSDFATLGRGVITINPKADGLTSFPESVEFTGVTGATKTLVGVTRGLDKDGSADTTLMRYHPVGTEVILSFGAHQIQDLIDYLNTLVVSTRNVIFEATAGETISAGDLVYFDDTDNEWKLCDADMLTTVENVMLGIAQGAGVDGGAIATGVLVAGHDTTNTGLTQGQKYYASNTPGGLDSTPGTNEVTIGYGSTTGNLYFKPRFDRQITKDEQDALVGTFGTPSDTNKYVTNDDATATPTTGRIARWGTDGKLPGSSIIEEFIAGATITSGQSLYIDPATQSNPITLDTSNLSNTNTLSFTVGNNANRILLVAVTASQIGGSGPAVIGGVTFGAVALTLVGTSLISNNGYNDSQVMSYYKLIAPAVSTDTITATVSFGTFEAMQVFSYYNVDQSAGVAGFSEETKSDVAVIPFVPQNSLVISTWSESRGLGLGGTTAATFTGSTTATTQLNSNSYGSFASALYTSSTSNVNAKIVINITGINSRNLYGTMACYLIPSDTGSDSVKPTSASAGATVDGFIGFAEAGANSGQAVKVVVSGVSDKQTGLSSGALYYASDTSGAIATSAGTTTRKVGIAISSTKILITNIW